MNDAETCDWLPCLTMEEYLEVERRDNLPNEYIEGVATPVLNPLVHDVMRRNIAIQLRKRLQGCMVVTCEMRVEVHPQRFYVYPDVVVVCEKPRYLEDNFTLLNPTFLVEVMRPGTRDYDRDRKAPAYREMPSVRGMLLADYEAMTLEYWERTEKGWRSHVYDDTTGPLPLSVLGFDFPVHEAYRAVVW